jgi:hypothetical protein
MHCTNCGNELAEGANVCGYCGTPVNGGAIPQGQPQGQPAQQQETYGQPQGSQPYNTFQQAQPNQYTFGQDGQKKILEKFNIYAIVCAAILAFSTLLPFASVSFLGMSVNKSLMDGGDGWFFLVVAVIVVVLSLKNINIGVIVMGVISIILMIVEMNSFGDIDSEYADLVSKGAGYYLMILGSIGVLVSGIVKFVMDKKK